MPKLPILVPNPGKTEEKTVTTKKIIGGKHECRTCSVDSEGMEPPGVYNTPERLYNVCRHINSANTESKYPLTQELKEYAKEINAIFMLVSAKNGDNVNNLFEDVIRKYLGDDFVKKVDEMKKDKGEVKKIKKEKEKGHKKEGKGKGFC